VLKKASSADTTSIIALFPWLAMPGKELSPLFSGPLWIALRLFPDCFAAIGKWFRRTAASPQAGCAAAPVPMAGDCPASTARDSPRTHQRPSSRAGACER
jgi:hypothetical protein